MEDPPKLSDIVRPGDMAGTKHHLRVMSAALLAFADQQALAAPVTNAREALRGLVARAAFELERLCVAPEDVEHAARAARNTFELNLLGRYVRVSANAENWFALRAKEQADILRAILRLSNSSRDPAFYQPM